MTIKYEELDIDPDTAKEMLALNLVNRNISEARVKRYIRAMTKGDWAYVGDPIRVTTDFQILDGQHRLTAIERSGITVRMLVISGVPAEHQKYMDAGRSRNAADSVHILGIKNSTVVAAAARLLLTTTTEPEEGEKWDGIVRVGQYTARVTELSNYEVADYVEAHTNLEASGEMGVAASRGCHAQPTALTFMHYLARRLDPYQADEFLTRLGNGTGLEAGSPIHAVRETINRRERKESTARSDGAANLALLILAWNRWRDNRQLTKIQLPAGGIVSSTTLTMV